MVIGQLRNRIQIKQLGTATVNDYGEQEQDWEHYAYAWASIKVFGFNDQFKANQVQGNPQYELRIHYIPNVTSTMKIVILPEEKSLDIVSIQNVDLKNVELVILAKESI